MGKQIKLFLSMPFGGNRGTFLRKEYDKRAQAIALECKQKKVKCVRVDNYRSAVPIMKRVYRKIWNCDIYLVDLSGERPNVYYELGVMDGYGCWDETILLVAKKGTNIHFNVQHRPVFQFSSNTELRAIIRGALPKMIKAGRQWREEN